MRIKISFSCEQYFVKHYILGIVILSSWKGPKKCTKFGIRWAVRIRYLAVQVRVHSTLKFNCLSIHYSLYSRVYTVNILTGVNHMVLWEGSYIVVHTVLLCSADFDIKQFQTLKSLSVRGLSNFFEIELCVWSYVNKYTFHKRTCLKKEIVKILNE